MTVSEDRVRQGLCPRCGKEAAPYRLCYDCREKDKIKRILKEAVMTGALVDHGKGYLGLGTEEGKQLFLSRPDRMAKPGDKRLRPRFGHIPVDVLPTVIGIFKDADRPLTTEEVISAWGRLREKRSNPLASDLASIVKAQRRREERAAKRLRH